MGKTAEESLYVLQRKFLYVKIISHVIMPNHVHFIIKQENTDCRGVIHHAHHSEKLLNNRKLANKLSKTPELSKLVRYYKARCTRLLRHENEEYFSWQRNYYEHVIRNKNELFKYKNYINSNPSNWKVDQYFTV